MHAHENHKKRSSHFARLATDKWINDYVNEQCCRVWEETNLHEVHQVAMHPQKVTAWCVFWARGVIGPYILENDNSVAVTVNGERYWLIKTNFFGLKTTIWIWTTCGFNRTHSTRYIECSARALPGHGHLVRRRRELATKIVQFNVDILGPYPLSKQGHIGLLIVLAHLSKFHWLYPLQSH